MNKFGAVLDDFGMETMLDKLMEDFIRPISKGNSFYLDTSGGKQGREEGWGCR